jgi:ATP-dependent exoDNAse (exonuclease V) alpha subunit
VIATAGGFALLRKQFPLRVAYAVTINRAQGQELDRALVDIRDNVFTHGQCYVALSRVRRREHIALFLNSETELVDGHAATVNIVFPELLLETQPNCSNT